MNRPNCKCHGEPMYRNAHQANGKQKWACRRSRKALNRAEYERGGRARLKARYEERKARRVCTRCEGSLTTEALCWECLNELEVRSAFRV